MNRKLRETISRGFSLSLSHDQCRALCLAAQGLAEDCAATPAIRQLEARGLVAVAERDSLPRPTRAGGHMVGLIREAGLFGYYTSGGNHGNTAAQ